jgi:hypothetical protein
MVEMLLAFYLSFVSNYWKYHEAKNRNKSGGNATLVLFTGLHVTDHYFISWKIIHLEGDLDSRNSDEHADAQLTDSGIVYVVNAWNSLSTH